MGDSYVGGLVDISTRELFSEAIYYNGLKLAQVLTPDYIEGFNGKTPIHIKSPVLFAGIMSQHFGHFVSESIARLYALDFVRDLDPFVFFYAPDGRPRYLEQNNFAHQILAGFNVPLDKVIFGDDLCSFDQILIPEQKYGFGYLHDPDSIFIDFLRSFEFDLDIPNSLKDAELVYVSRSHLGVAGSQIGEPHFEAYLAQNGYVIFHPEEFTLNQQLSVYSSASKLVFSEGSAVLSCILLPDIQADIAVISRRRDYRRSIRVATDCFRGLGKNITWIDVVKSQYQFGMNSWEAVAEIAWDDASTVLLDHGFVSRPFSPMGDEEHLRLVHERLCAYIGSIECDTDFISYMSKRAEIIPKWTGPSHLTDPRNGRAIWPEAQLSE